NNEFLGFIKDDAYNEDYKLELKSQTTTEQLENLRNNMREFKDIHSEGKFCPTSDDDDPKESIQTLDYINENNHC
ncbi:MAG: hypothetical protein ACRC6X_07760, partial [Culicoidibacterales bacterium]